MDSGRAGVRPAAGDAGGVGDGGSTGDAAEPNPNPPIRIGPNGQVETEAQYEARIAHNSYMRFSRSLKRTSFANYESVITCDMYVRQ